MDCSKIRDLLPDYSVEILDGRTQSAVRSHLESCADCRHELAVMDSVVALVEEHGVRQPPAGLFNAVRNRIEGGDFERERPAWWFWFNTRPARSLAMGMAMAAVAVGIFMPVGGGSNVLPPISLHTSGPGQFGVARGELANAIRQHAMSTSGPLTDRVAWEAMAQMVSEERDRAEREPEGK